MAEFEEEGLGDIFGSDDDLLGLLESIQNNQDNGEDIKIPDPSAGREPGDDSVALIGSSEDAFKSILGTLDMEEIAAAAEEPDAEPVKKIEDYDKAVYGYPQLDEIQKGLERGLDVGLYDSPELSFRQMREIRIGLEQGLDVSYYTSKYYKDTQMREIRLGLMEGLDVSSYARLIYSLPDMQKIHKDLLRKAYDRDPASLDFEVTDADTGVLLYSTDNAMKAYMKLKKKLPDNYDRKKLQVLLNIYGITSGLITEDKDFDVHSLNAGDEIEVAKGEESVMGEDGWYEYFVEDSEATPHMNDDGSVDYMAQRKYSYVQPGQRVALYHPATQGRLGHNVRGMELPATSGRNLPRLSFDKICILDDGVTYVSKKEGLASVRNGILDIIEQLEFKEDVGYGTNVSFEGDIYVHGSVLDGAILQAGGDIVINGTVEAAIIKAGGDVVIRRGMNSDNKGELEAGGNVVAAFFENANVVSGGNVEADYIMNSNIFCKQMVITRGRRNLICGGRIVAGEGIQTGTVGNDHGIRTDLEVGAVNSMHEALTRIRKRRRELDNEMDKVRNGMNQVLRKVGALNGRTNPIYLKLQDVLEQQKKEMIALDDAQDKLDDVIHRESNVFVNVYNTAYRNTRMIISGNAWLVDQNIERSRFFARGRSVSFTTI